MNYFHNSKVRKKLSSKPLLYIILLTIVTTILVWAPFFLNERMARVFANYDGPNYIVVAKCWYNPNCIRNKFSLPLPLEYYPAHFPGYSAAIWSIDKFLPGWWAMLVASVAGAAIMIIAFYLLLKELKISRPLWLASILLFLPARMLVLRTVGAPETLFIGALLLSILFFRRKQYLFSGLFLALAQAIKTPAILLFAAYGISICLKEIILKKKRKPNIKKLLPYSKILLGPTTILLIFWLFKNQTGNFWAYFHSGDNFHLVFPPFQTFISGRSWLGDFWLEDIIYVYLLGGIAVSYLIKKYKEDIIAVFPAIFYLATLFVAHRDLSRYSAPLYPFWILAFANFLKKKEFKIAFFILLPAIYLYAVNFINYNTAPIADWTPYF